MPHGARTSLAALMLILGIGGASAESAATTWTDPPAHKAVPPKAPASDPKAAAPAPSAATPAAATETRSPPARRKAVAVAVRRAPEPKAARAASVPKRVAAAPRRARVAAAPARTFRGAPQVVAAAPPPPEGYARYRAYNYGPGYGYGYAPGYAAGYTDDRLDRLSSAQAAGYVVVHRRTVQFPDGRTLRVYRPDDEGEPF